MGAIMSAPRPLVHFKVCELCFLAEIDRMQLEVREYFSFLPTESLPPADSPATDALYPKREPVLERYRAGSNLA